MTKNSLRRLTTTLGLALVASAALHAQTAGRLVVKLEDPQGKPIAGARIVVTSPDREDFHEEKTTNKHGTVLFAFNDATLRYALSFEADGFDPAKTVVKPTVGGADTKIFKLYPSQAAGSAARPEATKQAGEESGTTVYTPAEKTFNEGVVALKAGDTATAEAKFKRALELDDQLGLAHSALAGLYLDRKDYQDAIASAQRLIDLEPSNPRGYRVLHDAYEAVGKKEEADAILAKLSTLEKGADRAVVLYNAGAAALKVGDTAGAVDRFQEAVDADPTLLPARRALAIAQLQAGRYQEAVAAADAILAQDPKNADALGVRYDAYRALGDEAKTKEAFEALAEVEPKALGRKLFTSGVEQFNQGEVATAEKQLTAALEADPSLARAHYYLGLCAVNGGRTAEAKRELEKFLAMAPDDPEAPTARSMLKTL